MFFFLGSRRWWSLNRVIKKLGTGSWVEEVLDPGVWVVMCPSFLVRDSGGDWLDADEFVRTIQRADNGVESTSSLTPGVTSVRVCAIARRAECVLAFALEVLGLRGCESS